MALRTLAAVTALCALSPAAAVASARPNFPRHVSGTISGTATQKASGNTVKSNWTISGARFRLAHVHYVEATWTGFYEVSGGTVTFEQSEIGNCGYSIKQTFALKGSLPSAKTTTPLFLERTMLGQDKYDGMLDPTKKWNVVESCSFPDQDPEIRQRAVAVPNLFNTGEKHGKIGRAMSGKFVYRDDAPYNSTTTTYKWSLRPR
jgi:hypothetical protein